MARTGPDSDGVAPSPSPESQQAREPEPLPARPGDLQPELAKTGPAEEPEIILYGRCGYVPRSRIYQA